MASVAVYRIEKHTRSFTICGALEAGIKRIGDRVRIHNEAHYVQPDADVAVFYGQMGNLPKVLAEYVAAGRTAVCVDLGYWARKQAGRGGKLTGYHKFAVNARHPTKYFRARPHDDSRVRALGLALKPWRAGKHILVAGMSAKSAKVEGFGPEEWERAAVQALREHTDRPIVYRPKPSWKDATQIEGTTFSPAEQSLEEVLSDCHMVVTHHSNAAADGLVDGVPAMCVDGVALPMGISEFAQVEQPVFPEDRQAWLADVSWCQFHLAEIAKGIPWRHLKDEGLVP